jgi:putative RNA 2'-phosphotransferase
MSDSPAEHDIALSKLVSVALRHDPERFGLSLDEHGWTPIDDVLRAIRARGGRYARVTRADLVTMIATSAKQRHEINGERIRALYGHSVEGRVERTPASPPDVLYHGTPRRSLAAILEHGLRPMSRQYVHLSPTVDVAREVGGRRDHQPVILAVDAAGAHRDGVPFYRGNDAVWLADHVPARYLSAQVSGRPAPSR